MGTIIFLLISFGICWGGFGFFVSKAFKNEKKSK